MEITFLRGATILLSDGHKRLICDPWLEDGIYYGAWAHYPQFTEEEWTSHRVTDVDYIYISHVHPDHYDPKTLKHFKGQKVIIHKYANAFLRKKIEGLGFEVVELDNGAAFDMGHGFNIRVFAADDCDPSKCGVFFKCVPGVRSAQIDTLGVITTPAKTVVNVNDCPIGLSKDLAAKIGNDYKVDLACVAYALAGALPQCYRMPATAKALVAEQRSEFGVGYVAEFARLLKTKNVLPFAGDYQLCGRLADLNEWRGIPPIEATRNWLLANGLKVFCNNLSSEGRLRYIHEELRNRKLDYEDDPEPSEQEIADLLKPAFERFDAKRKEFDFKAKSTIHLHVGDGNWFIIPPTGEPHISTDGPTDSFVAIATDPKLLKRLLMGPKGAHWNNAEIGSHLIFERAGQMELGMQLLMSYFHG